MAAADINKRLQSPGKMKHQQMRLECNEFSGIHVNNDTSSGTIRPYKFK